MGKADEESLLNCALSIQWSDGTALPCWPCFFSDRSGAFCASDERDAEDEAAAVETQTVRKSDECKRGCRLRFTSHFPLSSSQAAQKPDQIQVLGWAFEACRSRGGPLRRSSASGDPGTSYRAHSGCVDFAGSNDLSSLRSSLLSSSHTHQLPLSDSLRPRSQLPISRTHRLSLPLNLAVLPVDAVELVLPHLDVFGQRSLSRTCRSLRSVVFPVLVRRV